MRSSVAAVSMTSNISCKTVSGSGASGSTESPNNFSRALTILRSSTIFPEISSRSTELGGMNLSSPGIKAMAMLTRMISRSILNNRFLSTAKTLPVYLKMLKMARKRSFIMLSCAPR